MIRVKTFNATGVAPDGRLYAGDLNAIQDAAAGLADFTQTHDVGTLRVGDSAIQLVKFATLDARITAALRTDGILRGLGGLYAGTFTTAARNAIAAGSRPFGLIIFNTDNSRHEVNVGSDATPNWQSLAPTLGTNSITSTELADNAVDTNAIQDNAITQAKHADNSVGTAEIIDANVTLAKLAANSVDASKIVDGSVGAAEIADGSVGLAELGADSVNASKIVDGSVGNAELANDAVNAAKIQDGTVGTAELANDAVTGAKAAPIAFVYNGGNYTLVLADKGKFIEQNVASANTVTVPTDASVAFPVGTEIAVGQVGAGQTTIAAAGGVTLRGTPGLKIAAQYGTVSLIKRAANDWYVVGNLAP